MHVLCACIIVCLNYFDNLRFTSLESKKLFFQNSNILDAALSGGVASHVQTGFPVKILVSLEGLPSHPRGGASSLGEIRKINRRRRRTLEELAFVTRRINTLLGRRQSGIRRLEISSHRVLRTDRGRRPLVSLPAVRRTGCGSGGYYEGNDCHYAGNVPNSTVVELRSKILMNLV
jgi:hypothetical protein